MTPSSSPFSAPTSREVLLVVLLFFSLLFFSNSQSPYYQPHLPEEHLYDSLHAPEVEKDAQVVWGTADARVPETQIVAHAPGWTILTNLYAYKGTFYLITDSPSSLPPIEAILSKGIPIPPGSGSNATLDALRLPTPNDIQIISKSQACQILGTGASRVQGLSWIVNDPPQFITHYYHWAAELWFGLWRTYSSLSPPQSQSQSQSHSLPAPNRLLFTHLSSFFWRDYASLNQFTLRASFPSLTLEFSDDWADRASLPTVWVFDQVLLADRSAAMQAYNYQRWQRTASVPWGLPLSSDKGVAVGGGMGVGEWWMPIRDNVVRFAGVDLEDGGDASVPPPIVITYVSRQDWPRRKLRQQDHEALVKELKNFEEEWNERVRAQGEGSEPLIELNIVSMAKISRQEQIRLAARTTILLGVHGNGLTSLLWMDPSSQRSNPSLPLSSSTNPTSTSCGTSPPSKTIIEFFYPQGFAHDYEWTSRAMGMVHFGFWGDSHFTSPNFPIPAYPEGFQGNDIPINAKNVVELIRGRVGCEEEVDD